MFVQLLPSTLDLLQFHSLQNKVCIFPFAPNVKNYNNKMPYDYFMKGKDSYVLNDNLKSFLEEVFTKLYEDGEVILKKKTLYKMYLKHTKTTH